MVSRVTTLAKKFDVSGGQNSKLEEEIKKTHNAYKGKLDEFKFNEALIAIWDLIHYCDALIEKERPWEGGKDDVISDLLFAIQKLGIHCNKIQ